ncbi:MAG: SEL1-like repeat protein [Campylobacteraceae bacterium]|nr:SEL1-like repeat protein [Campylobacteraceae bacterium]
MNDLDFVKNFDTQLGEYYNKAKNYCIDTPTHSLIILRNFVSHFTQILAEQHNIDLQKTYLYKKIEQLSIVKKIDNNIISILHEIRVDSNQGAHFDKSNLSLESFSKLAKLNLKRACKLIELFYIHLNKHIPTYDFEEISYSVTKQMCYEAIMDNDVNAQYIIGLNLQAKAKLEHIEEYRQLKEKGKQFFINPNSFKLLDQSTYWFKQAALGNEHEEAIFEFAMCLLYGEGIQKNEKEGERLILIAANKNSMNAKAILGAFYLEGSLLYKQDYKKALSYLESAAKEEHPEALTNLSYMYKDAIGVKKNLKLSFKYMQKASYAGFSHAQYHLSNFYFNAIGVKQDQNKAVELLHKAFKNDYAPAILTKARLHLTGEYLEKDLQLSEKLFITYIELENDFNVLLELAENYIKTFKECKSKEEILSLLKNCIDNSNDLSIKNKAIKLQNQIL